MPFVPKPCANAKIMCITDVPKPCAILIAKLSGASEDELNTPFECYICCEPVIYAQNHVKPEIDVSAAFSYTNQPKIPEIEKIEN